MITYRNKHGFPPTICIEVTKWCNLKCTYCRAGSSPHETEQLDFNDLKNLLYNLSKNDKWRISLSGGEPFFWKHLLELLVVIHELDFPFNVTTNGYTSLNSLKKIPSKIWDNGRLHVSIDGNKYIHNKIRGIKSFEKAMEFIKDARNYVPTLFVNTVLYSNPEVWADELYSKLSTLGVDNWTIISPVRQGRWKSNLEKELLSTKSYIADFEYIESIVKKHPTSNTTITFLDFAKADRRYVDVVFIDSNGEIRLPGFYNSHFLNSSQPLTKTINLSDSNAAEEILTAVSNFITSEKYIL